MPTPIPPGKPQFPPPGNPPPPPPQPAEKPDGPISDEEAERLLKRLRRGEYIGKPAK